MIPDGLVWGRIHGYETLFWLEVGDEHKSRRKISKATTKRLEQAMELCNHTGVRLVYAQLSRNWVHEAAKVGLHQFTKRCRCRDGKLEEVWKTAHCGMGQSDGEIIFNTIKNSRRKIYLLGRNETLMNKQLAFVLAFALTFLFLIQMMGILVESIYILDLMNTSLDAKVLGLLFFFTPVLLLPFRKRTPTWAFWLVFILLLIARGVVPFTNTLGRMFASGIGTGSALLLLAFMMSAGQQKGDHPNLAFAASTGLALAVAFSVLLRTIEHGLDYSLMLSGGWLGWGLALLLGWTLTRLTFEDDHHVSQSNEGVVSALLGIFLTLALVYFAFSAPAVIARWTQGNYFLIVTTVSLLSVGWAFLALTKPDLLGRIPHRALLIWNLFFSLSLTMTLLAQRISFPLTPNSPAVTVGNPNWIQYLPLIGMLLSFPVIYLDLGIFFNVIQQANPSPRMLAPGMLLGSLALVLLVFINIFTNVWGDIQPISGIFRNQFYLPFLLITGTITLLAWLKHPSESISISDLNGVPFIGWAVLLGFVFLGTTFSLLQATLSPDS